eukprot:3128569-Prymnesium_polylepis.1
MGRHGTFRVSQGEAACGGNGRTRENEFPLASAHFRRPGHPALGRRLPRAVLQTISPPVLPILLCMVCLRRPSVDRLT